jgi:CheY-like chemotaxis protein
MVSLLRGESLRIALVVEHDGPTASSIAALLDDEGYRVLCVPDYPHIDDIKRLQPELIVLGVPEGEASFEYDFATAIQEDPATNGIAMMVLSDGLRDVQRNAAILRSFVRAFGFDPFAPVEEQETASSYLD